MSRQPDQDASDAESHAEWDDRARNERPTQMLDRNWDSLLQELRVVQTGVQLLTGFLLTLPFQPSFAPLPMPVKAIYLVTVAATIGATMVLVTPVAMHRSLFRQRKLAIVVGAAHRLAESGLTILGVALLGVVFVVVATVTGNLVVAAVACLPAMGGFAWFWIVLPFRHRRL